MSKPATNSLFSRKEQGILAVIGMLVMGGALWYDLEQREVRMAALTPAEPIVTRVLPTPAYKGEYVSGGKVSTTYRYWTFVETNEWVLLNGKWGGSVCPAVLDTFVQANVPNATLTPEQIDVLTMAYRGQSVTLRVHVPRFKSAPQGLNGCLGVKYDAQQGLLTLGGKPVAVLAAKQPELAKLANAQ